jgi:hypothetical protein
MRIYRLLFLVLFLPPVLLAEYTPKELFTIPWGDGPNELKIAHVVIEGYSNDNTPCDFRSVKGPNFAAIDRKGNFVIGSGGFNQLKGYNKKGKLIFSLLDNETPLKKRMNGQPINNFYLDSRSKLYIVTFPGISVVPIADYSGNIIDSLVPFEDASEMAIYGISGAPNGTISISDPYRGNRRFYKGNYLPGGSVAFLANDDRYYVTRTIRPSTIRLYSFTPTDSNMSAETENFKELLYSPDTLDYAIILNGGDGSKLFVSVMRHHEGAAYYEMWICNFNLERLEVITFPKRDSEYDSYGDLIVTSKNEIYEQPLLDDGLHVIKWIKK